MIRKDYIRRSQQASSRRQKSNLKKKEQHSLSVVSLAMVVAVIVLIIFAISLYFISYYKKKDIKSLQYHKTIGDELLKKPEERWRYIKELENHQLGVQAQKEPFSGRDLRKAEQPTDEQRQFPAKMQSKHQQSIQLIEVPQNEKIPDQPQVRRQQMHPIQQPKEQSQKQTTQPYQRDDPLQASHTHTISKQSMQKDIPATREIEVLKQTTDKKNQHHWMIQCGSFRGIDQAEIVRAQLAFEGFDSFITTNNGWNRVLIGPIKGEESADDTISRLNVSGYSNCIRLTSDKGG